MSLTTTFIVRNHQPPLKLFCILHFILCSISLSYRNLVYYITMLFAIFICVLCYIHILSFCSRTNLNQWYQSNLLLLFLSACPQPDLHTKVWVLNYFILGKTTLVSLSILTWREKKREIMDQNIKIKMLLEEALARQMDEMIEKFAQILRHMSTTTTSLSSGNFEGTSPFKI